MAAGGTDGSLKFDTKIDTSGFDGGISSLSEAVERLSKAIDNLSERIAQGFGSAGSAAVSASANVETVGSTAEKSEAKVKSLQEQMDAIEFHDMEETPISGKPLPEKKIIENPDMYGYDRSALDFLEEYGEKAGKAAEHVNEFKQALEESKARIKELESQGMYFGDEEYDQALIKYERLKKEAVEYKQLLFNPADSGEVQHLNEIAQNAQVSSQKIVELTRRLEELKARQKELSSAGVTTGYTEYDANQTEITRITARINEYRKSITDAGSHTTTFAMTAKNAFSVAAVAVAGFAKKIGSNLTGKIKQAVSNLKRLGKSSNSVSKSILKLSSMFKLMLIRMAMRAAVQGVKEGMQNLVKYSDSANRSISNLMSGMTYLKNSFAAAFAPILSIVAPILNTLINLLATAISYVNQFFAALGGGTTFVRAKKVNQDYAKSLKATGGAAKSAGKDAKKALAPFDELNQLQENAAGGGSGGGGGAEVGDMFETVGIDKGITDFVNQLKDLWSDSDWKGIGKLIGGKINDAVLQFTDYISWGRIGGKITAFVTAFTSIFNSLVAAIDWYAIGVMMSTGINTLAYTLYLLLTQIDWFMLGNALSQSLMGMVHTVNWAAVGATIGAYFQAQISGLLGFIIGADWITIGAALATSIMGLNSQIDWAQLGYLFAAGLNAAFGLLGGFAAEFDWSLLGNQIVTSLSTMFQTFDWGQAGEALSTFVLGLLDFLITVVQETDWAAFVQGIVDCIEAIDWIGFAGGIFELLSSALAVAFNALAQLIGTLVIDGVAAARDYFAGKIEECGGNIAEGILKGINDALAGMYSWIYDHIYAPFINGILKAFGIQGASSSELKQFGQYLWNGFTDGVKKFFADPGAFIKANITDPFVNGIKKLLGIHSPSTVLEAIGGNTVEGFNRGVEKGQSSSQSIIKSWASGVASWFAEKLGISSKESKESKEWANSIMSGYNNTVSQNYTKSQTIMETWAENIRSWFTGSGDTKGVNGAAWKKFADNIIKAFTDGVSSGAGSTKAPMETWAKNVKDWFWGASYSGGTNGLYQEFYNMAKLVNQGFAAGIGAFSNLAQNAMQKWGSEVIASAKNELDIHSPSRVAYSIAEYFVKGFNNGLAAMAESSRSTAEKWLNGVTGVFDGVEIGLPVGLKLPNAAAYLPRMASGTVVPPRAGEYERNRRSGGDNDKNSEAILSKLQNLIDAMKPTSSSSGEVHVYLEGEAGGLFRVVRQENEAYKKLSGESAFV